MSLRIAPLSYHCHLLSKAAPFLFPRSLCWAHVLLCGAMRAGPHCLGRKTHLCQLPLPEPRVAFPLLSRKTPSQVCPCCRGRRPQVGPESYLTQAAGARMHVCRPASPQGSHSQGCCLTWEPGIWGVFSSCLSVFFSMTNSLITEPGQLSPWSIFQRWHDYPGVGHLAHSWH